MVSTLTKSFMYTIEESYEFIINIFEEHKAFIKKIELNKGLHIYYKFIFLIKKKILKLNYYIIKIIKIQFFKI